MGRRSEIVVRSGLFDLSVYGLEVGFGFKIPTFVCVDLIELARCHCHFHLLSYAKKSVWQGYLQPGRGNTLVCRRVGGIGIYVMSVPGRCLRLNFLVPKRDSVTVAWLSSKTGGREEVVMEQS